MHFETSGGQTDKFWHAIKERFLTIETCRGLRKPGAEALLGEKEEWAPTGSGKKNLQGIPAGEPGARRGQGPHRVQQKGRSHET